MTRPRVFCELRSVLREEPSVDTLVGIDLGGTNIKVGLFDQNIQILDQSSNRTEVEKGFYHVIGQMADAVRSLCSRNNVSISALRAVGIGCPGPVDTKAGLVVVAPNFPGWRDLPDRDTLPTWRPTASSAWVPVKDSTAW